MEAIQRISTTQKNQWIYTDYLMSVYDSVTGCTSMNGKLMMSSHSEGKVQKMMMQWKAVDTETSHVDTMRMWPKYNVTKDEIKKYENKTIVDVLFRVGTYNGTTGDPKWLAVQFEDGTWWDPSSNGKDEYVAKEEKESIVADASKAAEAAE